MNEHYLTDKKLIIETTVPEQKIYIREQLGTFQNIRRKLSTILICIFIFLPLLQYDGHQAILFDLEQQTLQLFSFTLFPQDLLIITLLFCLAAFTLFYVTKLYGRVWCGFTCPQTIWTLLFNWIERRVEGSHNQSKILDKQGFSLNFVWRKLTKHVLWLCISLLTALVFISYFFPVEQLYIPFFTLNLSVVLTGWVLFFTGCTYINAGFIREKMCLHMCPYSRFQSAMFDEQTSLVTYDVTRGENRGKRKRGETIKHMGDCVDCNLCVQVCPAGIDIRNGLQYECINCGLCIDACDQTMSKFNYPKRLIDFSKSTTQKMTKGQQLSYLAVIALLVGGVIIWAMAWTSFEVNIIRDRQALYRINQQGVVENTYLFKIRNKANTVEHFDVKIENPKVYKFENKPKIDADPGELKTVAVVVSQKQTNAQNVDKLRFTITSKQNGHTLTKQVSFYGGNKGW